MKRLFLNKRFRFTISCLVIMGLATMVWWIGYYTEKKRVVDDITQSHQTAIQRLERLTTQKKALQKENLVNREKQDDLKRLSNLLVVGNSAGDINTEAQKLLRTFWEKNNIKLDTYKEIPGGKWRDNVVVRINYQFKCELDELSRLLKYFENLEKVIRIQTLNVHYLQRDFDNLQIVLTLEILSIANDQI
jgi:hypothetical protein